MGVVFVQFVFRRIRTETVSYCCICVVLYKVILLITTPAVSSTKLGSILIFASCALLIHRSPVFRKFW